jgi:predicted RNase H-like nuclease (RuvC/YqgF family)
MKRPIEAARRPIMGDYGSNAALGFIEGSIIGEGTNQVLHAWRQGRARRLQQEEDEAEYINLYNSLVAERNRGIDLQVKIYELDSKVAVQDAEIAKREHEIAKRDHEIALLTEKLHETERYVERLRRSRDAIDKMRANLYYAFKHYRRLLKINERGGDAYDFAWDNTWSPDHVPPDQRSE